MKFLKDKAALRGIAVFYVIALAVRVASLYVVPRACPAAEQTIWWQMLTGAGPAVGAIVAVVALRRKMYCSLLGSSALKSLACVALPALALALFAPGGLRAAGIFLGCIVYALLEETGWRGYLLSEFSDKKQWKRVLVVTAFWFVWHLDAAHLTNLLFPLILLLSSWGLDQLAHDTHSLTLCACFHGLFNLFKHGNGLTSSSLTVAILVASIVIWFAIWYAPLLLKARRR